MEKNFEQYKNSNYFVIINGDAILLTNKLDSCLEKK